MSGPVTPPLEVTEVDGSPDGRPITKIVVSNGDLTVSGRTATIDTSGSATTPAGSDREIQFNDAGAFGASSQLVYQTGSNLGRMEMDTGASATLAEIRAMTGHGLKLGSSDVTASAIRSYIDLYGENDAPSGVAIISTATGGTVWIKTTGTGATEIGNETTNQDTTLQVAGNGTGKPIINLKNDAMSASLEVTTNNELTIKGGTESFAFDVSSATGGMTFPDGTELKSAEGTAILSTGEAGATKFLREDGDGTCSWQAAGGGGSDPLNPILGALSLTGTNTRYETAASSPYGQAPNESVSYGPLWDDFCELYPFIAVKAGQLSEFGTTFGASSGGGMVFGVYDSDATTQMPDTLLAHGSIAYTSNASVYQTSLTAPTGTGVIGSLIRGEQYWCCYLRHTAGTDTAMKSLKNNNRCRISPIAECGDADGALLHTDDYTASSTFPDTFDTTNLTPDNNYIPRFSYKVT